MPVAYAARPSVVAAVFWFEAADEPAKSNYDMKHYSANWGVRHWVPGNPAVPFLGRFQQKY